MIFIFILARLGYRCAVAYPSALSRSFLHAIGALSVFGPLFVFASGCSTQRAPATAATSNAPLTCDERKDQAAIS
ncbi:MAG: hypothetical protein ABI335_22095, partial [Polyangiaceae bacterium]